MIQQGAWCHPIRSDSAAFDLPVVAATGSTLLGARYTRMGCPRDPRWVISGRGADPFLVVSSLRAIVTRQRPGVGRASVTALTLVLATMTLLVPGGASNEWPYLLEEGQLPTPLVASLVAALRGS